MSERHGFPSGIALVVSLLALASPARASVPALVIDGGTVVRVSGATQLVIAGDLIATGSFDPRAGSALVLAGYGSPSLSGVSTLAGLTLALHGTASIAEPMTVAGPLALQSGWLSLGGHDLFAGAITGGSAASYVVTPDTTGRLERTVGVGADVSFPVGNSHYDPVSLRTQSATDSFRVAVFDAPLQTGIAPDHGLTRAWAITHPSAATGAMLTSVQWNTNEQGSLFDRSIGNATSAIAYRWLDGSWAPRSGVRRTDNGLDPAVDSLLIPDVGLWTLASPAGASAVTSPIAAELPVSLELGPPAPHPIRGGGLVRFGLPREADVTLALYDVTGARRLVLADGRQRAGWHVVRLDASRVPEGVYFLRLAADREVRTTRCVVLR